jgi:GMP synthase (glutamine-hydrolysing)
MSAAVEGYRSMELVILQHLPHLPAGLLGDVVGRRSRPTRVVRLWKGEPLPGSVDRIRALVVLDGDEFVEAAQRDAVRGLLAATVTASVPVLGLCLGAQLLAEATGGHVEVGVGALGYIPVERTEEGTVDPVFAAYPDGMAALSLDLERIVLGQGAVPLARDRQGAVVAFRAGETAYGVAFHPELDACLVEAQVAVPSLRARLGAGGCDPDELVVQARRRDAFSRGMGAALLGRWVDAVVGRTEDEAPWGRRGPRPVPASGLFLHPA